MAPVVVSLQIKHRYRCLQQQELELNNAWVFSKSLLHADSAVKSHLAVIPGLSWGHKGAAKVRPRWICRCLTAPQGQLACQVQA